MDNDPYFKLIQSLIDLCASLNKRMDTLMWRLERTEREVMKLNAIRLANEVGKAPVEGGGK